MILAQKETKPRSWFNSSPRKTTQKNQKKINLKAQSLLF